MGGWKAGSWEGGWEEGLNIPGLTYIQKQCSAVIKNVNSGAQMTEFKSHLHQHQLCDLEQVT